MNDTISVIFKHRAQMDCPSTLISPPICNQLIHLPFSSLDLEQAKKLKAKKIPLK